MTLYGRDFLKEADFTPAELDALLVLAARLKAETQFAWNRVFEDLCDFYGGLTGEPGFLARTGDRPVH